MVHHTGTFKHHTAFNIRGQCPLQRMPNQVTCVLNDVRKHGVRMSCPCTMKEKKIRIITIPA